MREKILEVTAFRDRTRSPDRSARSTAAGRQSPTAFPPAAPRRPAGTPSPCYHNLVVVVYGSNFLLFPG